MAHLEFNPDQASDLGMLEIFAQGSVAVQFYDGYNGLVLYCLRPDIFAQHRQIYGNEIVAPDLSSELAIRKTLSGRLKEVIKVAANDLEIYREPILEERCVEVLATYCELIGEVATRTFALGDRSCKDSTMARLRNPLADRALIEKLWPDLNHETRNSMLPEISQLISFN